MLLEGETELNPWVLSTALVVLSALFLFMNLIAYCLRDFSRSRLDEYCRTHGLPKRFGEILHEYETALLAAEIVSAVTATLLVGLFTLEYLTNFSRPTDVWLWVALAGEFVLAFLVLVSAAVVVPWSLARVAGEPILARCWRAVQVIRYLAKPLVGFALKLDTIAHRLAGVPEPNYGIDMLTEEIRTVVDEGQREGLLHHEARTMIHRVMELKDEDVAAVMTPRTDMRTVHVDASVTEAREVFLEHGHSRLPVVGETIDDIIGILYAKDLLRHVSNGSHAGTSLRDWVRDPIYIPETTPIDRLLEMMKKEHIHIAIVIDEYSGVAGLVTMEDILEEIVGEITDEYDPEEEEGFRRISQDIVEVEGRVHIDDLNEHFQFDLPEDGDFETIGGFAMNYMGRVPKSREDFVWRQLRVTVLEADERRVQKLRIERDRTLAAAAADES